MKGRLKLLISTGETKEIIDYKNSKEAPQNNFVGLSKFSPNYAVHTLPRNYHTALCRLAEENCKDTAVALLNSLNVGSK